MSHVSNEDLQRFDTALRGATQRIGGGKIGLDSTLVRKIVRDQRDAARRYVEIHCAMAASQPGYLQPAIIVATALQVEFGDDSVLRLVVDRAEELNAVDQLHGVGFAQSTADLQREPVEREAARAWWKTSGKESGICDDCRTPIRRGDGYLIDGRLVLLGPQKMNLGEELLCRDCFQKHRNDPRDPGGKGGDYFTIR